MPRLALALLLASSLSGCAVSSSVSTASVTAYGDEVVVRRSEWGTTLACARGAPGEPACRTSMAGGYAP